MTATDKTTDTTIKIVELRVEQFMGVEHFHLLNPNPDLVEVAGPNRSGKTSVLRAVQAALGGKGELVERPVREGADEAEVYLDLGAYRVSCTLTADGKHRLAVVDAEGHRVTAPQTLLNSILGQMWRPQEFGTLSPEAQLKLVESLTTPEWRKERDRLEGAYQQAYEARTEANRKVKFLGAAPALVEPVEPVDVTAVQRGLQEIEAHNRTVRSEMERARHKRAEAERVRQRAEDQAGQAKEAAQTAEEEVGRSRKAAQFVLEGAVEVLAAVHTPTAVQIGTPMESRGRWVAVLQTADGVADALEGLHGAVQAAAEQAQAVQTAETALAALPPLPDLPTDEERDPAELQAKLAAAATQNAAAERYRAYQAQLEQRAAAAKAAEEADKKVKALERQQAAHQKAVALPEGLAMQRGALTWQGRPLSQLSDSEGDELAIRLGVALGQRIMLLDRGEKFDGLEYLEELAREHGVQLLVASRGDGHTGQAIHLKAGRVLSREEWLRLKLQERRTSTPAGEEVR
jgi:hypothetical protein